MIKAILFFGFSVFAVNAWTTGSAVSSFGGNVLITGRDAPSVMASGVASLEMKKGKSNVPVNMRSQYEKQKEMAAMRRQMMEAQTPKDDGIPLFSLFVRSPKGNLWYPCGTFKGDERSGALAKSYADGGWLAGISKKQLDGGIAGSLFQDLPKLKESIFRTLPQLKQSKDELQFGYKLGLKGLDAEKAKEIFVVEPKEQKGFVDNIKNIFS